MILKPFGQNIWTADGAEVVAALGFHYPTRMAVIRLAGGCLFVWSPVALTEGLRAEVDALGEVRHLVAPNALHHLFVAEWKAAWPAARIYAAPGLQQKRGDLEIDHELDGTMLHAWSKEIDHVVVGGNLITSEVVFFHHESGTVIFTDLIQQLPSGWFSGWRAAVARLDLMTGPEPSVPRKFRAAFTGRQTARTAIRRILAWPARQVLMAHGTPVTQDSRAFLKRAFSWLRA